MAISLSIKGSTARAVSKVISRDIQAMEKKKDQATIDQLQLKVKKLTNELQFQKDSSDEYRARIEELAKILDSTNSQLKILEDNSAQELAQEKLKMQHDKSQALELQKNAMQKEKEQALRKQEELLVKKMKQDLATAIKDNESEIDTIVAAQVAAQLISQTVSHQEEIESLKKSHQQELEKLKSRPSKNSQQQAKRIANPKNVNVKTANTNSQNKITSQEVPKEKKMPKNTSMVEDLKQENSSLRARQSKITHLLVPQVQHTASGKSAHLTPSLANDNMPKSSITDSLANKTYNVKQIGIS